MARIHNNPQFRPPAEADSLILQIDEGCPYNRCTFCGMYQDTPYQRRSISQIQELIAREARHSPDARRIFLADGDVMRRPFKELQAILHFLITAFPQLSRVNLYATGLAMADKTDEELQALRTLKLHTLYMGLESGDEATLRRVKKAETAESMIQAACRAQQAGLRMSVMILLGLGGKDHSQDHALATAQALNRMNPRLLSALRIVPVPGTELFNQVQSGSFTLLTEAEIVQELRLIIQNLQLHSTVFRANHTSNVIPLEARLPRDKERLLINLATLLASGELDTKTPGNMPLWL